jgi:hypothetical protein
MWQRPFVLPNEAPRLAQPFVDRRGDRDGRCGSENPDASTLVGSHWKYSELIGMGLREKLDLDFLSQRRGIGEPDPSGALWPVWRTGKISLVT